VEPKCLALEKLPIRAFLLMQVKHFFEDHAMQQRESAQAIKLTEIADPMRAKGHAGYQTCPIELNRIRTCMPCFF
jgi:hypothetical protein